MILHLPGADPAGPPAWAGPDAPPFLGRLRREGIWLRPSGPSDSPSATHDALNPAALLAQAMTWPGITLGAFNLPLPSLPRAHPGLLFAVPAPAGRTRLAPLVHPSGLAEELAGYLAAVQSQANLPRPRPHEADADFARQAALARLVFDHARRLLTRHQPRLCAVGLPGLERVRALNPLESGRAELILRQMDHYAASLAQAARAGAVLCLCGAAGALAWGQGPEADPPAAGGEGTLPRGGAAGLATLAARLLGLDAAGPAPW